jgi:hypothetical protein
MSGSAMKKAPARLTSAAHRNRDRGKQQESPANLLGIFLAYPYQRAKYFYSLQRPSRKSYRKYPRANSVPFVIRSAVRPKFRPWYIKESKRDRTKQVTPRSI